ncbi:hypothetical protein SAMN04488483_0328 [Pseudomonas helmanticensis]|uniref:Uncharacterized protein n=1 Tax=Pseudomonas helmanticensis TaxID=1471381 RepID=A0ACD2TZM5_9PSED|nr:hypothetical protein [Pseudomonas helmanticensis]SMQ22422.1 hypothetical protein SAMN04488483_0328 [Pseudomonas helmanticensis]
MINNLLNPDLTPSQLTNSIKTLNMSAEIKNLANLNSKQTANVFDPAYRAAIMSLTNTHTGTLTLHCNEHGNISLKVPDTAPPSAQLYSVPGNSVLFAINSESFPIQLYELDDEHLVLAERVMVDAANPLFIDGTKVLFDSNPTGDGHPAFIGSVNLPVRSADISVFDRETLSKVAWFPHDDSAARYMVSLELLEATADPDAIKVAKELIYHYHPAVAWKAFQLIRNTDQRTASEYVPLLKNLQNRRLDFLLEQSQAA